MGIQWCIIYLTDADLARFLKRCICALRPGGIIVIKENVLDEDEAADLVKDDDDSSVTRSTRLMLHIFREAGLDIFQEQRQQEFPEGMLAVMMYALRPSQET